MGIEQEDRRDVQEAPRESRGDSAISSIAKDSQQKPDDQKAKEQEHEVKRRQGLTPSSKDLPSISLVVGMVEKAVRQTREIAKSVFALADGAKIDLTPRGTGGRPADAMGAEGQQQGVQSELSWKHPIDSATQLAADLYHRAKGDKPAEATAPEQPRAENQHLRETLKEKGLNPPEISAGDRRKLEEETSKAKGDLKTKLDEQQKIKEQVDPDGKKAEEKSRLESRLNEINKKPQDAARAEGEAQSKLSRDMQASGLNGRKVDAGDPKAVKEVHDQIAKVSDPEKRKELQNDLSDLEKKHKASDVAEKEAAKLSAPLDQRIGQLNGELQPLTNKTAEVAETRDALGKSQDTLNEAKFGEDLKEIDKLPKEQREAVYKAMEQVAKDSGGPPNNLSPEQRQKLVEQMAHQVAHPEAINQGTKGTCGLATTEAELARKHPDKYAQTLADLATRGEAHGGRLKVSSDLINSKDGSGKPVPQDDGGGNRSMASKMFQSAAAQRVLELDGAAQNPPKGPQDVGTYVTGKPGTLGPPTSGPYRPSEDSGERVKMPDGTTKDWPGASQDSLAKLTTELTGEKHQARDVFNPNLKGEERQADAEKNFQKVAGETGLPMKAGIKLEKGDFTGMNTANGHHEVNVTKIEGNPPKVYFDNPAGGADHSYPNGQPVPLKEFVKAMDGPHGAEGFVIAKAPEKSGEQSKSAAGDVPSAANPATNAMNYGRPDAGGTASDTSMGFWDRAKESVSGLTNGISPEMAANAKTHGKGDAADATRDKAKSDSHEKAPSSEQIMKHMDELNPALSPEKREQMRKDLAEIDKLPPEKRDKIHASLDKIAKGDASATKLDDTQRAAIASSLAHQIAHPESIKQANKDTCVGANAEKLMAREHPDTYADMVARLSTEGKYTAPGGKTIEANMLSGKILTNTSTRDGQSVRSQASDVFQNGAMNLALEGRKYRSYEGQTPHEVEVQLDPNGKEAKDAKETKFMGLDPGSKEKILNQLCPGENYKARPINSPTELENAYRDNGDKPLNVTITQGKEGAKFSGMDENNGGSLLSDKQAQERAKKLAAAIENPSVWYSEKNLKEIDQQWKDLSPDQLKQVKEAFKKDKTVNPGGLELDEFVKQKMDKSIMTDADKQRKQDLLNKLNEQADPSKGPTHAVTITKIENGKVYYENTADTKGIDHSYPNGKGVPIDEFTKAMQARKGTATVSERKN